ncbi:MAG: iron chelate uptake ABC transporter family permease subunit [Oscillospiraceae bacterium]|nr:iron chelate uptake ABC transporter family permease subunit [Oscillospiraceae bacterium]
MEIKVGKQRNVRLIAVFAVILPLFPAACALYIYSRTYAKSLRLGLEITPAEFSSIMSRAVPGLLGMSAAAILIALVSLSFQTITQSRILTPSMIGFDSLFIATQTVLVFAFSTTGGLFESPYINYFISAGVMLACSMVMYRFILQSSGNNVIYLLMFGLVLSGVLENGSRYLQLLMSNNDYYRVQAATNVTVNNMNTSLVFLALPALLIISVLILYRHRTYNVMSLGAEQSQSLGVFYAKELNLNLIFIALGMSLATALIGSLTFLGLLAVNVAREILKTHRHFPLFIGAAVLSALALILGQSAVELLQGAIPVTAIINLVGCSYMFYLILRENRI